MNLKKTEIVYVACAFWHNSPKIRKLRVESAAYFCAQKMREGTVVFCPLVHHSYILKYGLPIGWDYWEKFNVELLNRSDRLIVLKTDGWDRSEGLQGEIEIARKLGLPIEYHNFEATDDFMIKTAEAL